MHLKIEKHRYCRINTQLAIHPSALSLYIGLSGGGERRHTVPSIGGSYHYDCRCQNNLPPHSKNKKCQNCVADREHVPHNRRPAHVSINLTCSARVVKISALPSKHLASHSQQTSVSRCTNVRLTSPNETFCEQKALRILYAVAVQRF